MATCRAPCRSAPATCRTGSTELPRDRPIATICASGYRASVAASLLRAAGFERVAWVSGGVPSWQALGLPLERGPDRETGVRAAPDPRLDPAAATAARHEIHSH